MPLLKRGTLLLLTGAVVLGGGVLLFENFNNGDSSNSAGLVSSEGGRAESDGELLLPVAEEDVDSFEVIRLNDTLRFNKTEDGTWEMSAPETGLAEGGAVAFLLSQLTSPTAQTLTLDSSDNLSEFGLDNPSVTVNVTAAAQSYQVFLGGPDFSGDNRYVQVTEPNPSESETSESETSSPAQDESEPVKVHVVTSSIVNAVERPVAEWLISEETPANSEDSDESIVDQPDPDQPDPDESETE